MSSSVCIYLHLHASMFFYVRAYMCVHARDKVGQCANLRGEGSKEDAHTKEANKADETTALHTQIKQMRRLPCTPARRDETTAL